MADKQGGKAPKRSRSRRQSPTKKRDTSDVHEGNARSEQLLRTMSAFQTLSVAEMRAAIPIEQVVDVDGDDGENVRQHITMTSEATGDRSEVVAGTPPRAKRLESTADVGDGYTYPAPFTRYNVFPEVYQLYPYCTVGKVFFMQGNTRYVGSAFSIGGDAIFTAGHCVHPGNGDPDAWYTDFVFVPAYNEEDDNPQPFGQWPASFLMARQKWINNGNPGGFSEDLGGAVLQRLGNERISDVVGSLGFASNIPRFQHWHAIGYPAGSPFQGKVMVTTQASYAYDADFIPGTAPIGIGCDMTGGCSGGPWITAFGTENIANGLNSFRRTNRSKEMFSPYFGDAAKELRDDLLDANP